MKPHYFQSSEEQESWCLYDYQSGSLLKNVKMENKQTFIMPCCMSKQLFDEQLYTLTPHHHPPIVYRRYSAGCNKWMNK